MITDEQLKQWRTDAEKATNIYTLIFETDKYGFREACIKELIILNDNSYNIKPCFYLESDAQHIVNACPQNFIALIDEITFLKEEVDRLKKQHFRLIRSGIPVEIE